MHLKKLFGFTTVFVLGAGGLALIPMVSNAKTSDVVFVSESQNIRVSGNSLTLIYDANSNANGFELVFENTNHLTCENVSIVTKDPYAVTQSGSFQPASQNNEMPQFSCTTSQNPARIILSSAPPLVSDGFRPWADHFNVVLGDEIFIVNVESTISTKQLLTRGDNSHMRLESSFTGCGLAGTILQRVYDCSKKITNYAVTIDPMGDESNSTSNVTNADGTSLYYKLFSQSANTAANFSDPYWFVVSCPNANGTGAVAQQSCAWLSPVVKPDNPALDTAGTYKTFVMDLFHAYQPRLLLSGKMTNEGDGYTFTNANGFWMTKAQVYPAVITPGSGTNTPAPTLTNPSVCTANAGDELARFPTDPPEAKKFPATDYAIRNLVSADSGANISWQMPSYPMLNILTGGTPTYEGEDQNPSVGYCTTRSVFTGPSFCNRPLEPEKMRTVSFGFSALNVPGFVSSENPLVSTNQREMLFSSSIADSGSSWLLVSIIYGGYNLGGFVLHDGRLDTQLSARCVSLSWF